LILGSIGGTRPRDGQAFNWGEWGQLRRILEAGLRADTAAFKAELLALDQSFPMSGRAGAYLWFALRYQVAKQLQRRPSSADLTRLSSELLGRFKGLVTADAGLFDELLHVVFEFRAPGKSTSGAMLIVNGAAALSVLLDAVSDLDEIETHLVPWYDKNGTDFSALNPLGT
jgi:hypothetical protein